MIISSEITIDAHFSRKIAQVFMNLKWFYEYCVHFIGNGNFFDTRRHSNPHQIVSQKSGNDGEQSLNIWIRIVSVNKDSICKLSWKYMSNDSKIYFAFCRWKKKWRQYDVRIIYISIMQRSARLFKHFIFMCLQRNKNDFNGRKPKMMCSFAWHEKLFGPQTVEELFAPI